MQNINKPDLTPCSVSTWQVRIKVFRGHTDAVNRCQFFCDESRVLSTSTDCSIKVWDPKKGEELRTLDNAHTVNAADAHCTEDGSKYVYLFAFFVVVVSCSLCLCVSVCLSLSLSLSVSLCLTLSLSLCLCLSLSLSLSQILRLFKSVLSTDFQTSILFSFFVNKKLLSLITVYTQSGYL